MQMRHGALVSGTGVCPGGIPLSLVALGLTPSEILRTRLEQVRCWFTTHLAVSFDLFHMDTEEVGGGLSPHAWPGDITDVHKGARDAQLWVTSCHRTERLTMVNVLHFLLVFCFAPSRKKNV